MKKTLHIDFEQLSEASNKQNQMHISPTIKMAAGSISYDQDQENETILQEFDGLLGFINMLDCKLIKKRTIPLHVEQSDLHIFYLIAGRSTIEINDLQHHKSIKIAPSRGRFIYLPKGKYELVLPNGRICICNFYFRFSIFRDGNERPFKFLHPLISAHRNNEPFACSSVDFRIGPRTHAHIHHLLIKLKKGDLDTENHILQQINELIKLSHEKIFEEYHKVSGSILKAREAYDLIVQYVEQHGQNFSVNTIAEKVNISRDYLHEIFHQHYKQSPSHFKYTLLEEKIKNLLLTGLPIFTIAYSCGYTEGSRLSKFFKKRTGMTPTEFIARAGK